MARALQSAHLEGTASYKLRTYVGPSVLVIDELGYLPMDQASANWIFQVVSRRYDRGSIILTSKFGQVLDDFLNHACRCWAAETWFVILSISDIKRILQQR